eukprot:6180706-Pleurochrysis_carterae.AAC.5
MRQPLPPAPGPSPNTARSSCCVWVQSTIAMALFAAARSKRRGQRHAQFPTVSASGIGACLEGGSRRRRWRDETGKGRAPGRAVCCCSADGSHACRAIGRGEKKTRSRASWMRQNEA